MSPKHSGLAALLLIAGCQQSTPPSIESRAAAAAFTPRVVTATYDTGTNPFHPCWQRPGGVSALDAIPEIRGIAEPVKLTFESTYAKSLAASKDALESMHPFRLYAIEGTNLLVYTGANGGEDLVDTYPHGSQASSQIACAKYGMAPDAYLVIVNWYGNSGEAQQRIEEWSAQQEWIDVIHLNIQQITPSVPMDVQVTTQSVDKMLEAGKFVVIAAGNGWDNAAGHIPTETIDYYRNPGVLIAGANDGTGYAAFSNLDPHTVMDGCGTVSAEPSGFHDAEFAGTSSASPRTTGYVTELLRRLRAHFGAAPGTSGAVLVRLAPEQRPSAGPLSDGVLTEAELHEVVRKTADPTLEESWLDGGSCTYSLPRPADPQGYDYHRVGYGKLTEHSIERALAVLVGSEPMPERPTEDQFYEISQAVRDAEW